MAQTDRTLGLIANAAFKVPVKAASSANHTLSGEQTVGGTACVTDDRVLLKTQTNAVENGVWVVDTGAWARAKDFDGSYDVVKGTMVLVEDGSNYWRLSTNNPIVIGTTALSFVQALVGDAANIGFLPAGVGVVARTVQDKERDIVSVFDFMTQAQIADVRARTALVDVTVPLNTAYASGANNKHALYEPAGTYKSTDTLWIVPEGSSLKSACIIGAGNSLGGAQTIHDASTITGKPAMNMQIARNVYLGHFLIVGGNKEIQTDIAVQNLTYGAAYVSGGFRDSRYSPHCGIAVDAGVGATPPDGGYSGFTYRNVGGGTLGITLDHVTIRRFVVGYMHCPDIAPASQGDLIALNDCNIFDTKVAIASGQTQARCFTMTGGFISWCRTAYDGMEYGLQGGNAPVFTGVQFVAMFELFSHSPGSNPLVVNGGRAEEVHRIGQAGTGGSSGIAYPTIFNGLDMHLLNSAGGKRCPIVWESAVAALHWTGGSLKDEGTRAEAFFILAEPAVFESVQFEMSNRFRPFIGLSVDLNTPAVLKNCRVYDATGIVQYGQEPRRLSLPARVSAHASEGFKRVDQTLYTFVAGASGNYKLIGTTSNIVFTATTLTFDNTDAAGGIMVGDLAYWMMNAVGKSVNQQRVPAAKVTSVAAPTVTCALLFHRDYYDETYAPGALLEFAVHEWAPGQALTGDTNSNTTLSNVSPTTILQNGDYITAAAGIPTNTRVLSGGGTATITLSRAATDTAAGKTLFFGRVHTVTTAAAF